jgi:hypothetical protein
MSKLLCMAMFVIRAFKIMMQNIITESSKWNLDKSGYYNPFSLNDSS